MQKKRNTIILIAFLAPVLIVGTCISLWIFSYFQGLREAESWRLKTGLGKIGQVVVCDRDIPEGKSLSASDIYEREIEPYLIKPEYLLCKEYAIGKQAKYGVSAGQIVSCFDLGINQEELEKNELAHLKQKRGEEIVVMCSHPQSTKLSIPKDKAFRAVRDIKEGDSLNKNDLELAPMQDEDKSNCISDIRSLVGRPVKYGISQGQFVHKFDLVELGDTSLDLFVASRNIKAGEQLTKDNIQKTVIGKYEYPNNAVLDEKFVHESKASQPIAKSQVIRCVDITGK